MRLIIGMCLIGILLNDGFTSKIFEEIKKETVRNEFTSIQAEMIGNVAKLGRIIAHNNSASVASGKKPETKILLYP